MASNGVSMSRSLARTAAAATCSAHHTNRPAGGRLSRSRSRRPPPAAAQSLRLGGSGRARRARTVTRVGNVGDDPLEGLDPNLLAQLDSMQPNDWSNEDEDWDWDRDWDDPNVVDAEIKPHSPDDRSPWHQHPDATARTPYLDLEVGTELEGTVSCLLLDYGAMVDVGADYDALCFVDELDWYDVREVIEVGMTVTVRVKATRPNTGRYVFPLEIEIVSPDISDLMLEPPLEYPPVFWREADKYLSMADVSFELGRPMPLDEQAILAAQAEEDEMTMDEGEGDDEETLDDGDVIDVEAASPAELLAAAGLEDDEDDDDMRSLNNNNSGAAA